MSLPMIPTVTEVICNHVECAGNHCTGCTLPCSMHVCTVKTASDCTSMPPITDGKKSVRMVSFLQSLRETLDDVRKTQSTVSLVDCTILSDKGQDTIYLNEKMQVQNSPKKFSVPAACGTSSTKMCDLCTLCRNTSVLVKVISLPLRRWKKTN